MCQFFSFVTLGDGKLIYCNAEERENAVMGYSSDSHINIVREKLNIKCESDQRENNLVNKYQYIDGWLAVIEINVNDDRKLVKKEITRFALTEEFRTICFTAVKQDSRVLKFIKEQTPEMCFMAIKSKPWALKYVKKQTLEMCLAAVKQDGWALQFVKRQTPEICLTAVRQDGLALRFVKKQTPKICLAAVRVDGWALEYVKRQTPEICLAAVKNRVNALQFVKC